MRLLATPPVGNFGFLNGHLDKNSKSLVSVISKPTFFLALIFLTTSLLQKTNA